MPTESVACNTCGKAIIFDGKDEEGRWIRRNPDGTPHVDARKQTGARSFGRSAAEQHDIRREAVLNTAQAWAAANLAKGKEVSTEQLLMIAEKFHDFVMKGRPS